MRRALWGLLLISSCGSEDGGVADAGVEDSGVISPWEQPFVWALAEPHECPPEMEPGDLVDSLVTDLGLEWPVGIPRSRYESFGGRIADDPSRLSFTQTLQADARLIPCFGANMAARADLAVTGDHPIATMIADAATQLELAITVGGPWPALDESAPLLDALDALHDGAPWDRDAAARAAAGVPLEVRGAAARVLLGAVEAIHMRDRALSVMAGSDDLERLYAQGTNDWLVFPGPGLDPDGLDAGMYVGSAEGSAVLYEGAVRLAQALDEVDWAELAGMDTDELYVDTPVGAVLIRGSGQDTYDDELDARLQEPLLLVLDLGGNDIYRMPAGANTSAAHPVAVHVDLGGDDIYGYAEHASFFDQEGLLTSDSWGRYAGDANYGSFSLSPVARQGAGLLGYGVLLDLGGGIDTYHSHRRSQGFANFGVGVLWDDGGNDEYVGENGAQASALVGIAILYDGGGDDRYRSFGSSQGFAWVSSFAALYDASGNDTYEMVVDEVVLLFSPQTPGSANGSLGQGTAFGWRRDANGAHFSGGLALLRDRAGNDRYEGSTFVQGVGYWMALGVLADAGGDDYYDGLFYAQGAAAHFALGAFLEGDGDDWYNTRRPPLHSTTGLGHDFSVSVFVDGGGSDTYLGPDRSIGAAKCHGVGMAVDLSGDDQYESHQRAIGWATDYDWAPGSCGNWTDIPSYGLFVDAGGTDVYTKPDADAYGNDTTWITDDPDDEDALEISGGIDGEGAAFLRAYGDTP